MNTYLAVDNETGGFEGTSLLQTYLAVLDEKLDVTSTLSIDVKPDSGIYQVEAGGLAVNKIDLVKHDETALTYSAAGKVLRDFLLAQSLGGHIKLIPLGHGVTSDMIGLRVLLSRANLEMYTSYRKLDTAVIAQYLKFQGKLPESVSGSLESLVDYFGLTAYAAAPAHTAKGDVGQTIAVLRKMSKL